MVEAIKEIDQNAPDAEYFGELYASLIGVEMIVFENLGRDVVIDIRRHVLLYDMSIKSLYSLALMGNKEHHALMVQQVKNLAKSAESMIKHTENIIKSIQEQKSKLN